MAVPIYAVKTGSNKFDDKIRQALNFRIDSSIPRAMSAAACASAYLEMVDGEKEKVKTLLRRISLPMVDDGCQLVGLLHNYIGDKDAALKTLTDGIVMGKGNKQKTAWLNFLIGTCMQESDPILAKNHMAKASKQAEEYGLHLLKRSIEEFEAESANSSTRKPVGKFNLTDRELEVLSEIAIGKTDAEIADALFISVKTVSNHVGNILKKVGAGNRTEAANFASERKLIL